MSEQYVKVIQGCVRQLFMIQPDGKFRCVNQEFVADDCVSYEDPDGTQCDPSVNEESQPFDMEKPPAAANIHGVCVECHYAFDDNDGKDMCKTCEEWYQECGKGGR